MPNRTKNELEELVRQVGMQHMSLLCVGADAPQFAEQAIRIGNQYTKIAVMAPGKHIPMTQKICNVHYEPFKEGTRWPFGDSTFYVVLFLELLVATKDPVFELEQACRVLPKLGAMIIAAEPFFTTTHLATIINQAGYKTYPWGACPPCFGNNLWIIQKK